MTNPTHASQPVHTVLVPGYWLGGWAWDAVVPALRDAGLAPHAVTLPGLGEPGTPEAPRAGVTLDDQVAAVVALVDGLDGEVVLVGHSGGAAVVQMVADQRPDRVRRLVYVDAGPLLPGAAVRPGSGDDVPLPAWEQLTQEGCSTEGMDEASLAAFRARAGVVPGGVATAPVRVHDARRLALPVTVICTSIPSPVLRDLVGQGMIPSELEAYGDVEYVDLPTGHWPMFSRPTDLAVAIAAAALG